MEVFCFSFVVIHSWRKTSPSSCGWILFYSFCFGAVWCMYPLSQLSEGLYPFLHVTLLLDILLQVVEFNPGYCEAALHLSCQNQQIKTHNPYMSHFQLVQAQLVPATDFISWNVKCPSLSSLPSAPMHCWQSFILLLALEDKGSCQAVLVCNTMIHFARTLVLCVRDHRLYIEKKVLNIKI